MAERSAKAQLLLNDVHELQESRGFALLKVVIDEHVRKYLGTVEGASRNPETIEQAGLAAHAAANYAAGVRDAVGLVHALERELTRGRVPDVLRGIKEKESD